jgi:predicted SprT family Zn-dependent metalloprotease
MILATETAKWLKRWGASALVNDLVYEISPRLSTSLGMSYPERGLIRLNRSLLEEDRDLLEIVLCHELAHVVIFRRHGKSVRPHGPEWQALMRAIGFEPNANLSSRRRSATRQKCSYRHTCPVCHATHTANRCMTRWRCPQCVEQGLEGTLLIEKIT